MKFVCDNCKAKYQIADDKVAGKTVRMKCRRCQHLITVSATVTESSVARRAPAEPSPARPAPPRPLDRLVDDEATSVMASPLAAEHEAPAPRVAPPPRAPLPPPRPSAQRVSGLPPAPAPRQSAPPPAPRGAVGVALRAPAPAPSRPEAAPPAARSSLTALAERARAQSRPGESAARDLGGLAGAFNRAMAEPAGVSAAEAPGDDWYVGVGGVPLGPIRLSDIREKAAAGAVTGDSLVWREGFDEWQPLKNFAKLLEIVDEARQRRSGVGAPPAPARRPTPPPPVASAPFNLVRPAASGRISSLPAAPSPVGVAPLAAAPAAPSASPLTAAAPDLAAAAPAPSLSGAGPSSSAESAAPGSFAAQPPATTPSPAPVDVLSDPFARPAEARKVNGAGHAAPVDARGPLEGLDRAGAPASGPVPSPFADVSSLGPAPPPSVGPDVSVLTKHPKRRGMHPMAYAFIAMAAVFGGVAAWVVFVRPPQVVFIEKQIEAAGFPMGAPSPPPPPTGEASPEGPAPESTGAAEGPRPTAGGVAGGPVPKGGTEPPASSGGANIDTSGFDTGVEGPSAKSPKDDEGKGSGGQLSQGEIEGVVSRNQPMVRRRCWEPALAAASSSAPKSAKVNASISIGPSGGVQSASASGAASHYPTLAPCIQGQIQGWKFPSSGGTTKVNVPFAFVGH